MLTLLSARYELQRSLQLALFHLAVRREIAAEQDGCNPDPEGDADLAPVADAHEPHHQAADRLVEPPHSFSLLPPSRDRTRCAIRLGSENSSMNPGLACWRNSPPDSPNPASDRSYRAYGEDRATGVADPRYSFSVTSPVT